MYSHAFTVPDIDLLVLLDEEFDKVEITPPAEHVAPALLCDELAWEDQLDNGDEMSL
jgi:hypothetical protein